MYNKSLIMLGNFSLPISLNASCDPPFESTASVAKKEASNKQIEFEKSFSVENNTDYQSFLLPLEQDFTKSSKGYASLLASIPDKDINGIHYKNKLKGSNMELNEHFSNTNYVRNTSDKDLNNSCSTNHDFNGDADNLYYEKITKFNVSSNIIEDEQSHVEITLDASYKENHVSKNNESIMLSEKCSKTIHNYSVILSNSSRFNDKSEDGNSSETNSSYNDCNIALNFDDVSSIDDSISSEKIIKKEKQYSNINIKQTFVTAIYSDNSEISDDDDDCLKTEKSTSASSISEDCTFESGSNNLLNSLMTSQRDLCDPIITISSEGYINACFEDDDILFEETNFLKSINESWNDSMKNISEEPHESKRVSFVPLPDLVSVYSYEAADDNYRYSVYVLDQLRFQSRIQDFESIIAPYLMPAHRENIYRRNCFLCSHDHVK